MDRMTTEYDVVLEPKETRTRDYAYVNIQTDRDNREDVETIMSIVEEKLKIAESELRGEIDEHR